MCQSWNISVPEDGPIFVFPPPSANHIQKSCATDVMFIFLSGYIRFTRSLLSTISLNHLRKTMAESKKKAPATHPPCIDMIVAAIGNLKEKNGSSAQAIKKYIAANYTVDIEKSSTHIKKAFVAGVEKKKLIQTKGKGASGSFKLNVAAEKADAKAKKVKEAAKKKAQKEKDAAKKVAQKEKAAAKKKAQKEKSKKKPAADKKSKTATKKTEKPKKKTTKKTPTKKDAKKAKPAKKTATKKAVKKVTSKKTVSKKTPTKKAAKK